MTESIAVAIISGAVGLVGIIIGGILTQVVRSMSKLYDKIENVSFQLNAILNDIDKRLIAVETTVQFYHPAPSHQIQRRESEDA